MYINRPASSKQADQKVLGSQLHRRGVSASSSHSRARHHCDRDAGRGGVRLATEDVRAPRCAPGTHSDSIDCDIGPSTLREECAYDRLWDGGT